MITKQKRTKMNKEIKKKRLDDTERIEMLWKYIVSLEFNGDIEMNRNDEGYDITFTWKNQKIYR